MTWQRFALTRAECRPFGDGGLEPAPPWREFMDSSVFKARHAAEAGKRWRQVREIRSPRVQQKANSFYLPNTAPCRDLVLAVNAALALRRPLLLTGLPGSGKTTLAFVLAEWLGLGPVLEWPVSPGASLADALATYNPLARLQDLELAQKLGQDPRPVEHFVRLGPVGTAFLPGALPRVLLIDEIDKGDLSLANELLHLFEEGKFPIPELQRAERNLSLSAEQGRHVDTWDEVDGKPVQALIRSGQVQCHQFPLVVMSSNGERDFPPAFNRRCLRVQMPDFSNDQEVLKKIVDSQLGRDGRTEEAVEEALDQFSKAVKKESLSGDVLATDQLLNLAFLMDHSLEGDARQRLSTVLLQGLNSDLGTGADAQR
jgi:MoxR-like ATPase